MKVILNRNGNKPRIELSPELVKRAELHKGDYVLIYKEKDSFNFGFMKLHDGDTKAIDGTKVKKYKGVWYLNPTTPPMDYLLAAHRVSQKKEFQVEQSSVKDDPLFVWKNNGKEILE